MKRFEYDNPRYLNTLVMYIEGSKCEIDATLMPDIPEFVDAVNRDSFFTKKKKSDEEVMSESLELIASSPELVERFHNTDTENIDEKVLRALYLLSLCKKHNIMPFWQLKFNNSLSQWREPEIKYVGRNLGCSVYDEPYKTCVNPIHFTRLGKNKWYQIEFENIIGEKSSNAVKSAISEFIRQGYVVTRLSAGLNPSARTADHYYDYTEYDARLFAYGGDVEVSGVPDDFELPKKPPELTHQAKLLERVDNQKKGKLKNSL